MVWARHNPQPGLTEEIDYLGAKLSIEIDCAVRFPAYNKNLFECKCGVIFPLYVVKSKNWKAIKQKHQTERVLVN
ncbi:hypothetical protein LCGC14_2680810 [marine sediment metagenome]|uniref:Uncharacterized protein n=1 Tax=marine sediment metagenome TaxID=412755 RepID=A0A0F8ZLD8_9ZZZZ